MKRSVGNITFLFLGIFLKAQVGCLAMPEPNVNVNVDVNIKERNGKPNGCPGLCSWVWNPICTSYKLRYKSFSNMDCFQTAKESDPAFKEYEWKYDGLCDMCPKDEGFLRIPVAGNQCIKILAHQMRNWIDSNKACQDVGLQLAKPIDPVAMRKFIVDTLGNGRYYWIGARGSDAGVVWVDGTRLYSNNSAWWPGMPGNDATNPNKCVKLMTYQVDLDAQPDKPYYIESCLGTPNLFAMCE